MDEPRNEELEQEARIIVGSTEGEIRRLSVAKKHWEKKRDEANQMLQEALKALGVSEGVARIKYAWSKWTLTLGIIVTIIVSFAVIYTTLAPSNPGKELWIGLIALGGAVAAFIITELVIIGIEKVLTPRRASIFMTVVSILMMAVFMGGMMQLAMSRATQGKLHSRSDSVIINDDLDTTSHKDDPSKTRKQVEELNRRGTMMFFCGWEWLMGLYVYRAMIKFRKYRAPICHLKERNRAEKRVLKISMDLAGLGSGQE